MSQMPDSAAARDVAYHVRPHTDLRRHQGSGPVIIDSGDGVYVRDEDGNRYLDTISGLWCAAPGFSAGEQVDDMVSHGGRVLDQVHAELSTA